MGVMLWPAGPLNRGEIAVAACALVSILVLARLLYAFDAPPEAGGVVFLLAGVLYAVRLSRWVLWPRRPPAIETWELPLAFAASLVLTMVVAVALFAVGAGEPAATPVMIAFVAYVDAILIRSLMAQAPPVFRAAWPALGCLGVLYVAASAAGRIGDPHAHLDVVYVAIASFDVALFAAMYTAAEIITTWAATSQRRLGCAVIGCGSLVLSWTAAMTALFTGVVSTDLSALAFAGCVVGFGVVICALISQLPLSSADWSMRAPVGGKRRRRRGAR